MFAILHILYIKQVHSEFTPDSYSDFKPVTVPVTCVLHYVSNKLEAFTAFQFRINCLHRTYRQTGCNTLSPRYKCSLASGHHMVQQECLLPAGASRYVNTVACNFGDIWTLNVQIWKNWKIPCLQKNHLSLLNLSAKVAEMPTTCDFQPRLSELLKRPYRKHWHTIAGKKIHQQPPFL